MDSFDIQAGAAAFGDGQHPTTQGVLTMLRHIDPAEFHPRIACDMGAGSGILSFAIMQQFSCPVIAVDQEATAVAAMQENATRNHLQLGIHFDHASLLPLRAEGFAHPTIMQYAPYDLIVANMLDAPLMTLAGDMEEHLASSGVLIISGLLQWQETAFLAAYEALSLERLQRIVIGDWVTLGFGKP